MNKIIKVITLGISILVLNQFTFGQCNTDPLVQKCSGKLGDFTFLKVYKVDKPAGEQVEFSYVFSGNTSYIISLCDDKGTDTGLEVSLYDSNRKLVSTNKLNGKVYPAITYNCKSTGIYYMTYALSEASCGVSVLGFKK
ncbi:MAG: hypothetical protein ACKVOU_07550 [Cytophagales bacterium]